MDPHAFIASDSFSSPPPLPPKTLPPIPAIPSDPPSRKPLNSISSVRRKPLPSSALSPPLTATTSNHNGKTTASLDQEIEPLNTARQDSDSTLVARDLDQ